MISIGHHSSGWVWMNSRGERIDSKLIETPINDSIGNNPNTAIDFIDGPSGERITFSKEEYMGLLNAIYDEVYLDVTKEEFVNEISSAGMLTDGLVHPIDKGELLAYMNKHDNAPATNSNSNSAFHSLQKVGVKLTKEELLELLKKSMEEKKARLNSLEQIPKIDTKTLLEYQKNIQPIEHKSTALEQLLTK
jgi:hypothetical protein